MVSLDQIKASVFLLKVQSISASIQMIVTSADDAFSLFRGRTRELVGGLAFRRGDVLVHVENPETSITYWTEPSHRILIWRKWIKGSKRKPKNPGEGDEPKSIVCSQEEMR